jgi:hypothetical protein
MQNDDGMSQTAAPLSDLAALANLLIVIVGSQAGNAYVTPQPLVLCFQHSLVAKEG